MGQGVKGNGIRLGGPFRLPSYQITLHQPPTVLPDPLVYWQFEDREWGVLASREPTTISDFGHLVIDLPTYPIAYTPLVCPVLYALPDEYEPVDFARSGTLLRTPRTVILQDSVQLGGFGTPTFGEFEADVQAVVDMADELKEAGIFILEGTEDVTEEMRPFRSFMLPERYDEAGIDEGRFNFSTVIMDEEKQVAGEVLQISGYATELGNQSFFGSVGETVCHAYMSVGEPPFTTPITYTSVMQHDASLLKRLARRFGRWRMINHVIVINNDTAEFGDPLVFDLHLATASTAANTFLGLLPSGLASIRFFPFPSNSVGQIYQDIYDSTQREIRSFFSL